MSEDVSGVLLLWGCHSRAGGNPGPISRTDTFLRTYFVVGFPPTPELRAPNAGTLNNPRAGTTSLDPGPSLRLAALVASAGRRANSR